MANPITRGFQLVRLDADEKYDLAYGVTRVIGRGLETDIQIGDPTLSRRHAELIAGDGSVAIRDLSSSNGTFLNGTRVQTATAKAGDTVLFGKIGFRIAALAPMQTPMPMQTPTPAPTPTTMPTPTVESGSSPSDPYILHERTVDAPHPKQGVDGVPVTLSARLPVDEELTQRKLALLLDVSTAMTRVPSVDALLDQIAGHVFQIMKVDRVAILLTEPNGALVSKVARDRKGGETARVVPRSIARRVVEGKVAVVSTNATQDNRFEGASIVMQRVLSAMCAPLIGMDGTVLGVLYVDNLNVTQGFADDDLAFLIAFCGIASAAIDNSRYSERIRHEAVARGNFERFFTPALAARIASSTDALRLGGEKRSVVILFSDIRGFTPYSEHTPPDELAALLNDYFTAMVECVFRHGGTLDKFIGDCVMAQWGAPVPSGADADRALAAAFDMLAAVDQLNQKLRDEGRTELRVGIGLNAGEVFAGYIGSERRLEYTILGEAVNTANRLCAVAAGGEVLISEEMLNLLKDNPAVQERTGLQLKGMTRVVRVYAVTPRVIHQ